MAHKSKPLLNWEIGSIVRKKSGKPFPHGLKTATIIGQCHNRDSGHIAFSFAEFDSPVDCEIVELI